MITQIRADIDSMDKIGAIIPQLNGGWSTRYPMYNGQYFIGSYRVPVNTKCSLKSISCHVDYKDIPRTNAMRGFALGTLILKLNGTAKMEYRLQWAGGTFNAITSDTSFGYNWRGMGCMKDLTFSANDVVTLEITPTVSGGLVPQVRYAGQMYWKLSTGQVSAYKFSSIVTTGTASQQIASYTVPAGGAKLQHFGIEGISADFMLGVIQVNLDGSNLLTMPCFSSAMMSRPVPTTIQLYGMTLGEGQEISVYGDFTHALNQTVQVEIFGTETVYATGGAGTNIFVMCE